MRASAEAQKNDPRYPVGRFEYVPATTAAERERRIQTLHELPTKMRAALTNVTGRQLETPYRDGGWTLRQVVHHVPDSHMNSYIRFKLALTEDEPTIKPYDESAWAQLPDSSGPIEPSLQLLESLHSRWVALLRSLREDQWKRTFRHPEMGAMTLEKTLALYDWHSRHHLGHVHLVMNKR